MSDNNARLMAARRWSVDGNGVTSISRRYLFERASDPAGTDDDEVASLDGLPALGTVHYLNPNLAVSGYDFEEGEANAKRILIVTVKYSLVQKSTEGGSGAGSTDAVEDWGWSSGSTSRDLTNDAVTGEAVLNSAGDPFDSVPQVERPLLTFRKVIKTKARKSWQALIGCVNGSEVTVGNLTCAVATLKVSGVDEEHIFGDASGWRYRYSIQMQFMSNMVKVGGADTATEIGWDVAFVDQGLRGRTDEGEMFRFTDKDAEGNDVPTSLPVLLDGGGQRLYYHDQAGDPFIKVVAAYPRATIPDEFYSEPAF